jgi:hypothetical protein
MEQGCPSHHHVRESFLLLLLLLLVITFMQCIYNNIPETNRISRVYNRGGQTLRNVRATYDKLQMFESRKTWTNITHTFLLLHAHFVTKILKYIYSPWTLNIRFNPADSQFIPVNNYRAWTFFIYLLYELKCKKELSQNISASRTLYVKEQHVAREPRFGHPCCIR